MWTNTNELDYLKSIIDGSLWDKLQHKPAISRAQILRNYIRSAEKRIEWGTFPKSGEAIVNYAKEQLELLERRDE